ncbi:hypothetical protein GCM10009616_11580 [Microlunatus lacustris]
MVLCVEREDASGADHQVVDVCTGVADRDGVKYPPARVELDELRKLSRDQLLTISADSPGTLGRPKVDESSEEGSHRRAVSKCSRLRPSCRAGTVCSEIRPRPLRSGLGGGARGTRGLRRRRAAAGLDQGRRRGKRMWS